MDLSVVIPTYNGAQRLPEVLEHLHAQVVPAALQWEIIVVDNNSQDETAAIAQQYQAQWSWNVPIRYVFEPRQGAAFARQTAIRQAHSDLVGFLDDDNLPAPNWVAEAIAFSQRYPEAGAFSGRIDGLFDVEPPQEIKKLLPYLAIRNHGDQVIEFEPEKLRLPPAASLVVRKPAWLQNVPTEPALIGRVGGVSMVGGEDYEVLLHIHKAGWKILYAPDLRTSHHIPPQRFERAYLLRLAKSCGLTTCQLKLITTAKWRRPILMLRIFLGSFRRLCLHMLKYKNRAHDDVAIAFEFEFHLGSLLSPLYIRRWS